MQGCGTDGEAEVKGHLLRPAIVIHDRPALFKPQRHNEAFSSRKSLISAGLTAKLFLLCATLQQYAEQELIRRSSQLRNIRIQLSANRTILCLLIRFGRRRSWKTGECDGRNEWKRFF